MQINHKTLILHIKNPDKTHTFMFINFDGIKK